MKSNGLPDGSAVITPCPSPGDAFYGQDACYQKGANRSYTKLGANGAELADTATPADGWCMTRDNVTGLVWEVKTDANKVDRYTWADAQTYCNNLVLGGYDDWRCPTKNELVSLVDYGIAHPGPTIDTRFFPKTLENSANWTSSPFSGSPGNAWYVSFGNGGEVYQSVSFRYKVRAVRAVPVQVQGALVGNGDGTVSDTATGLMWQKATAPGKYTWEQALAYCEGLSLSGYTDWRLPNVSELRSLVDDSFVSPAIDRLLAPYTWSYGYWTSSPFSGRPSSAWFVSFYDTVRAGQCTTAMPWMMLLLN